MKKTSFLLLLLLLSTSVFAQKIVPGYVITLEGDTLSGTIFKSDSADKYLRINFFLDGNPDQVEQYTPEEIKGYSFEEKEFFKSKELSQPIPGIPELVIFMKALVDNNGELSLFVFRDNRERESFFIEDSDKGLHLLNRSSYKTYLSQNYSTECPDPSLGSFIQGMKFRTKDLSRFIIRYNSCIDPDYVQDESYLSDGIVEANIVFSTGFWYPLTMPDLAIGIGIESYLNSTSSTIFEVGFSKRVMERKYTQESSYSILGEATSGDVESRNRVDLNTLYGSLKFKTITPGSYYYFAGAGLSYTLDSSEAVYSVVTKDEDFFNTNSKSALTAEREITKNKSVLNAFIGAGKELGKASIELRLNFVNLNSGKDKPSEGPSSSSDWILGNSITRYVVSEPKYPKFTLDFSVIIPIGLP